VLGNRASAQLSGNGAIAHNLSIIGGPVKTGDSVLVDYSTPEPTIIATSESWLTMDDLMREIAKLKTPEPYDALTEYEKWIVTTLDDTTSMFQAGSVGEQGWLQAVNYECWERFGDDDLWPDLVVRFPPGLVSNPADEHMDELYDGGVVASYVGDAMNPAILNNTWATQLNGNRYENISFRTVSTYSWLTTYNFFWWFQPGPTYVRADQDNPDWNKCIFRNCLFSTIGYPEDKYALTPGEYNQGVPYANHWIYDGNDGEEYEMHFYDCKFYARTNPSATGNPAAFHFDTDSDDTTPDKPSIYLYNCKIDCGPQPFNSFDWNDKWNELSRIEVYAYNCQFLDTDGSPLDPTTIANLTIMDGGDRSPVTHIHTSGSSGGFDANAIHTNVAGEW
jgi:hypothetical protein